MRKCTVLLLVCLTLPMAASGGVGDSWNFNGQIAFTANPNGAWSYGYAPDPEVGNIVLPYTFGLFTNVYTMGGDIQNNTWYGFNATSIPVLFHNYNADVGAMAGCQVGRTAMHPGYFLPVGGGAPEGNYACVARWTAPADEPAVKIQGAFSPGLTGTVSEFIVVNGGQADGYVIMEVAGTNSAQPFEEYVAGIQAGDTIDFVLGQYDVIVSDTTMLDAVITSVKSIPLSYFKAQDPDPTDGAVEVAPGAILSWFVNDGLANLTYDIYVQPDPNFDPNASPTETGLPDDSYDADPDLIMSRTYSWRVDVNGYIQDPNLPYDPENPYDYPIHVTGDVWTFTTIEAPTLGPDGEVISVNLQASGAAVGTNIAGVVPVGNWNDYTGMTGTKLFLDNDLGFSTYTRFACSGGGAMSAAGTNTGNPGDDALLSGHIYVASTTMSGTFTDIPYAAYDLYVYFNSGAVTNTQTFTIRGTSNTLLGYDEMGTDTALVESQNGTVNGNYVVFKDLTSPDVTIDATPRAGLPSGYAYLNGFQIVSSWNPQPADEKQNVRSSVTLTWLNPITDIADVEYDLYLKQGDSSFGDPITLTTASYDPEPDLENNSVYYWQVVMSGYTQDPNLAYNPGNPFDYPVTRTSPVWSFTVAGKAAEPIPANGAIEVDPNAILEWQGLVGYQHDVYFGTDAEAVANADINDLTGIYLGRQAEEAVTFDPYGLTDMDWGTTYYWRIDEVIPGTPDTILVGDVWSFTIIVPQCPTPLRGDTNDDCINDMQDLVNIAQSWLTCSLVPAESCPF